MWYDAILEIAHSILKNGLSLGTLGTAVYVLLKIRKIKRRLSRFLPVLFEDESEVREYVGNQQIIMENQRRIMAALGVEPACPGDARTLRTFSGSATGRRTSSIFSWAERLRARAAAARGPSCITSFNFEKRRMKNIKKWIKPDSLTVIAGAIVAAFSRYFGIEIDPSNILAAVILLLGYFKAHEYVTVVRDANGLPTGFRVNSRKLIFTGVAFLLIVADEVLKLNLGNELIFTITAAVTGYNYAEGQRDAKAAEAEGEEAKQMY